VDIDAEDPPADQVEQRLGDRLSDVGRAKLSRRGWPNLGQLIATTEGLLFIPDLVAQNNGALAATVDEAPIGAERVRSLFHWWSVPAWRRPVAETQTSTEPPVGDRSLRELLFESPGALFVPRDSIKRIFARWGRVQIERPPARTVTLSEITNDTGLKDGLRRLVDFPDWRRVVANL
jgi:hypothetical protein